MAKKVLWISDRLMTYEQEKNLQWLYGAEGEVQFEVYELYPCKLPIWSNIADAGKDCDIFAFSSHICGSCCLPISEILCDDAKTMLINAGDDWIKICSEKL